MASVYLSLLSVLILCFGSGFCKQEDILNFDHNEKHVDCHEVREAGYKVSGLYNIWLNGTQFTVYCNHTGLQATTVIQRRMNGNVIFSLGWNNYQKGFGTPSGDYWIGLEQIHQLTSAGNTKLTIFMTDWSGVSENVFYDHFVVLSAINSYTLNVAGFHGSGVVGDDFSNSNNQPFATHDRPDKNHCAVNQQAGWWYNYCSYALLNGHYYLNGPYTPSRGFFDGIYWNSWHGFGYSLKFVMMQVSR